MFVIRLAIYLKINIAAKMVCFGLDFIYELNLYYTDIIVKAIYEFYL